VTAPLPAGAPRFADFRFPAGPAALAGPAVLERHKTAWGILQTGDTKAADREFTAILKLAPAFYPAEAGPVPSLGRKDAQGALAHFDKTLAANASYAPALAGKGEALLSLGRTDAALDAFLGALAADPSLTPLRSRVDVLKFRGVQQNIGLGGRVATRIENFASVQPDDRRVTRSAFLYRELAAVEHKSGDDTSALVHAEQAAKLDPTDARALTLTAEILEGRHEWTKAAEAYAAVNALEPAETIAAKVDQMREKAAFATMPVEYRSIDQSQTVTRAQLAALIGARLEDLLRRSRGTNPVLVTDTRGSWAAP
jgi:tetratricopeptide (TPR) repeat protein